MIHDIRAYQESVATQEESGYLEEATSLGHGAVRAAEEIETEVTETMHWITHANGRPHRRGLMHEVHEMDNLVIRLVDML